MERTWILVVTLVSGCADLTADPPAGPPQYLALGDSVAFGSDPRLEHEGANQVSGYPEALSRRIGIEVTNAACPGEATGGFISPSGNDNNCRVNRAAFPLHVAYDDTQLAFAIEFLADHPSTALVTIDIGGNDISKLNDMCAGDIGCLLGGFVPMIADYRANLDTIFGKLRKVYDGPLVALAIYNPFPNDRLAQYGLDQINAVLAEQVAAHGGAFADGMAAFSTASGGGEPCAATCSARTALN